MLSYQVKLFSFLEIKVNASKMEALYLTVCPSSCFSTNLCHYISGRIVAGWDPDAFEVDIRFMSALQYHPKGNLPKFL